MDCLRSWMKMENKKNSEEKKVVKSAKKNNGTKAGTKKPIKKSSAKNVKKNINDEISLEEADSFYHVSLLAQAVCVIGVLAISVLAIFENSFTIPVEVLVGITLLIMAYNNYKMFNRRFMTVVYIIFGVISLFVGFLGYFGVTL